jgi:hypothetical protein
MHYQFELPQGALIDINGQRCRYLGDGMVTNMVDGERPYIINCVKNRATPPAKPVFEKGILLEPLDPIYELTRRACRSIAFAATAEEQEPKVKN